MSQGKQHEAGASEGARLATGEASASSALVGTGRWSARRKVSVVIEWLKGESLEPAPLGRMVQSADRRSRSRCGSGCRRGHPHSHGPSAA